MPRSRYLDDTDIGTTVWPVDGGLGADIPGRELSALSRKQHRRYSTCPCHSLNR
jgi:hypothetical protein